MKFSRLLACASLAFLASVSNGFAAESKTGFEAISATLEEAVDATGARGDALLIGQGSAILYAETAGNANLTTPVTLTAKSDLSQLTLMLALAESGFMKLDDPVKKYLTLDKSDARNKLTVRDLLKQRAGGDHKADDAAKSLILIAETASARSWDSLYKEWVVKPLDMQKTQFTKLPRNSKSPAGVIETNARDYSRLLAALSVETAQNTTGLVTDEIRNQLFRSPIVGQDACLNQDETAACNLIEQDSIGLYAWVDRTRGTYGVLTAPGAELSIAKAGRQIRAEAEAIFDREQASSGLTAATRE